MPTHNAITQSKERVRAADSEFLLQLRATHASLASSKPRTAHPSCERPRIDVSRKQRRDAFVASVQAFGVAVLLVSIVLTTVVARLRTDDRDPAGVADASRFVDGGVEPPTDGRLLMTTVRRPVSDDTELAAKTRAMRMSQEHAIAAAKRCLGTGAAAALTMNTEGVTGSSGGLILALAAMDALGGDDLTLGRHIAGTGTIREDGTVGDVLFVAEKARAAERAGADLFLAPQTQIEDARSATTSMRVAGVRTLGDAVRVLTGSGCPA